jgi:hypothetical protein
MSIEVVLKSEGEGISHRTKEAPKAHSTAKGRKMPILGIRRLTRHDLAGEVCHKCRWHRGRYLGRTHPL